MDFVRFNRLFQCHAILYFVFCICLWTPAFAVTPFQLDIVNNTSSMVYFHTTDHRHFTLMAQDHLWAETLPMPFIQYGYFDSKSRALIQIDALDHLRYLKTLSITCIDDTRTHCPVCQFNGT